MIDEYIAALKKRQHKVALEGLQAPKGRDVFTLGELHGRVQEIEQVIRILTDVYNGEDPDRPPKPNPKKENPYG